jgi:hypothetical protein
MKFLPNIPRIVIINNSIVTDEDESQGEGAVYNNDFKDQKLRQARIFVKKNLDCKAYKVS